MNSDLWIHKPRQLHIVEWQCHVWTIVLVLLLLILFIMEGINHSRVCCCRKIINNGAVWCNSIEWNNLLFDNRDMSCWNICHNAISERPKLQVFVPLNKHLSAISVFFFVFVFFNIPIYFFLSTCLTPPYTQLHSPTHLFHHLYCTLCHFSTT